MSTALGNEGGRRRRRLDGYRDGRRAAFADSAYRVDFTERNALTSKMPNRSSADRIAPEGRTSRTQRRRWQLEVDHKEAAARGGPATLDNLRLTCRWHNIWHAEETFGAEYMKKYRKGENATSNDSNDSSRSPPMAHEAAVG